jgi:hypothetical protein
MQMQRKTKTSGNNSGDTSIGNNKQIVDRWLAQQIRRNMITKVKPSGKIYKRNGKKDIK